MWNLLGWLVWTILAFFAISWAHGLRTYARAGQSFTNATAVQTLFLWALAILFLVSDHSKLHILWLAPASFFLGMFLALSGIPILTPLVLLITKAFVSLVLVGVRQPRE